MELNIRDYQLIFENGGLSVKKNGVELYFNHRPLYVSVKDYGGMMIFRDEPYSEISEEDGLITCSGLYITDNGSEIRVTDRYSQVDNGLRIQRQAEVIQADEKDLGFQTKLFFYSAQSDDLTAFDYFYPGQWYKDNRYAASYAMGKNLDMQYFYKKETYAAMPMFAMQHKESGETISMSRWADDATLPSLDRTSSENYAYIDEKMTVGSFGVSKAKPEALTYTYYGHMMKTPLPKAICEGVSIDYVYPAINGQDTSATYSSFCVGAPVRNITWVHPMKEGFTQNYSLGVTFEKYNDFNTMLRSTWREVYPRLKDRLFDVDNEKLFNNIMLLFRNVTKQFGKAYGTPFVCQLPDMDPQSFSAEIGFVGQQTGIGYQLLRWGRINKDAEAIEKGLGILDYWVDETMTEIGAPKVWLHLSTHQFEPQPIWIREIADGLEGILDAYVYEHNQGIEHESWLKYCISTADWLVSVQMEDGSLYRAYHYDGSMWLDSCANTPSIIRFLVQMYLVTGKKDYLDSAIKAGEWTYEHMYLGYEYRGGTCDQSDVMDKEAGIYAMFAFMSLYDITEEKKWLDAACGAADYVETFTFVCNFPVYMPYPCHPFTKNHITGQSHVTVGHGGGDVYMAACSYVYYRLGLLADDPQYIDFAEFINKNCKQANDVDGSFGYKYPGTVNEGGSFSEQQYTGRYHWLPWCNYVEADPASRFEDTFGCHEVADIEKLPLEERLKRNRIYDYYYKA